MKIAFACQLKCMYAIVTSYLFVGRVRYSVPNSALFRTLVSIMFTVFFSTSVHLNKTNDEAKKRAAYLTVQSYDIESSITTDIQKASGGTY